MGVGWGGDYANSFVIKLFYLSSFKRNMWKLLRSWNSISENEIHMFVYYDINIIETFIIHKLNEHGFQKSTQVKVAGHTWTVLKESSRGQKCTTIAASSAYWNSMQFISSIIIKSLHKGWYSFLLLKSLNGVQVNHFKMNILSVL